MLTSKSQEMETELKLNEVMALLTGLPVQEKEEKPEGLAHPINPISMGQGPSRASSTAARPESGSYCKIAASPPASWAPTCSRPKTVMVHHGLIGIRLAGRPNIQKVLSETLADGGDSFMQVTQYAMTLKSIAQGQLYGESDLNTPPRRTGVASSR